MNAFLGPKASLKSKNAVHENRGQDLGALIPFLLEESHPILKDVKQEEEEKEE